MTILSRLLEQRTITPTQVWGSDSGWASGNTIAGVNVSPETALNAPAVWACVRLLTNDIAGLPLHAYRGEGAQRQTIALPSWMDRPDPNPNVTTGVYIGQLVTSLLLDGNAFARFVPDVYHPEFVRILPPAAVEVHRDGINTFYRYRGRDLSPAEVVHIPLVTLPGKLRGLNPIDAARQSIGLSIAADEYAASYFGNGTHMGVYASVPPNVTLDPQAEVELKRRMESGHRGAKRAFSFGILTGGVELKTAATSNKDGQLHELRIYQTEEMARLFGIPPHMIGSQQPGAVAYASVEQRSIDYVTHAVQPLVEKLEDAHDRVIRGQRTYFKFRLDGLLRSDAKTRWDNYGVALDKKVIRREEVRALEDLPYDGDLGYLETPNNNAPEPAEPAPMRVVEPVAEARSEEDVPVVNVTANINIPESVRMEMAPAVVNVPLQPAPVVNVATDSSEVAEAVTSAVRDLAETFERARAEERRALDAMAAREVPAPIVNVAAPAVTVTIPDEQKVHILTQPKVTKTTRVTARDGNGRVVQTVTEE